MRRPLPIDAVLPEVLAAIRSAGLAVLEAPPGAGKTTRVPPALLDLVEGRILMLEPRRLAARAAAERIAEEGAWSLGREVGFRVRGEAKTSAETRIEVVTEGILTRMIQSDPELKGISAVIFDEFHERSLQADLGLALALEVRDTLRPDLAIIVMSATLDGAAVAALLGDAPVIRAEGRAFPVDTRWLEKPLAPKARLEDTVSPLIRRALSETDGGVLVFLPGEGEIRRVVGALGQILGAEILPLYGAMKLTDQRRAVRPLDGARKIVLATSIAETSLTIEDIRVVIDAGLARRARYDPGSGMARLVTEKVTRAEADQRRGRAGRVAEGVCYRLWTKGQEGALAAFPPAEIEAADLAPFALELAQWGTPEGDLRLLTPPPEATLAEAREVLSGLGALHGRAITDHGRRLATMPVHPRLAHMLDRAGAGAAPLAALLSDRDPLRGSVDLARRLRALSGEGPDARLPAFGRIRAEAKRLAKGLDPGDLSPAEAAALAYPDRIGLRRPGDDPRWLLSGGKGAAMAQDDPMAGARLIVVTDTDGHPREAKIRQAIEITEAQLRAVLGDQIGWVEICRWSKRDGRVEAVQEERFGAIALNRQVWRDAPPDAVAEAMLDGVRALGLRPSAAAERFRARVALARSGGADLPDLGDTALMDRHEHWLLPHLGATRTGEDWAGFDLLPAFRAMLDWGQTQVLDQMAPAKFTTPLGRSVPIDYGGGQPEIQVKLQELFGVSTHPMVAGQPLRIALLSPAGRPVQVTTDLPRFWATSYADVRKDMRGRYPKHPWPEDPASAVPTTRAKPKRQ